MESNALRAGRFALRLARDWTREVGSRIAGSAEGALSLLPEHEAFIRANENHWLPSSRTSGPRIVVEGHLALSGPNYLLRTGMVAKAIEAATGVPPVVVVDDFSHRAAATVALYRSFGIREFAFVRGTAEDMLDHAFAARALARAAAQNLDGEGLLALRFDEIAGGDLLYDDVIRSVPTSRHTVERVDREHLRAIYWANYYARRYRRIIERSRARHAVVSHLAYVPYGLLARAAFEAGAEVFETTDTHLTRFRRDRAGEIPVHHNGVHRCVQDELAAIGDRAAALEASAQSLAARVAGDVDDIDVQNAYGSKAEYARHDLRAALGAAAARPLVFVMAHVFGDSPHLAARMLHRDYHHFLVETLKVIARIPSAHWVIKEHPSASLYGEGGEIPALVKRYAPVSHVSMCPAELSTRSVIDHAHAIVTVNGTAGLEGSCFGVPAVVAGAPFYAGFGFTHEPATLADYEGCLTHITGLDRLTSAQIEQARLVWGAFQRAESVKGPLVTTDDLRLVWGYGARQNVAEAFRLAAERLRHADPRDHPAYTKALRYAHEVR